MHAAGRSSRYAFLGRQAGSWLIPVGQDESVYTVEHARNGPQYLSRVTDVLKSTPRAFISPPVISKPCTARPTLLSMEVSSLNTRAKTRPATKTDHAAWPSIPEGNASAQQTGSLTQTLPDLLAYRAARNPF